MTNRIRILFVSFILVVALVYLDRRCVMVRVADAGWRLPVSAALNLGLPVNTSCNGRPLLQAAVVSGNLGLVQLLVSRGANIDQRNNGRSTALITASALGENEIIRTLLAAGASVKARPALGESILLAPVHNGHLETVQLLLKAGVDCRSDSAALLTEAVREKKLQILNLLLENGAEPDARGGRGATALMWAAAFDDLSYLQLLLDYGANPSVRDDDGHTAIDWARREGRDVVQFMDRTAKPVAP